MDLRNVGVIPQRYRRESLKTPVTPLNRDMYEPPLLVKYQWKDLKGRYVHHPGFQVTDRTVQRLILNRLAAQHAMLT
jgi:hypothetical protein